MFMLEKESKPMLDTKPIPVSESEPTDPAQELLQNPDLFIEKYFDRIEEKRQEGEMKYKLIEYKPKTPEIAQLIKDLQFFMFGGNGNTTRERNDFPEFQEDENQQWNKLNEILEQHPEQALKDTKKALLFLSTLLQKVAGVDLINCFSHAFFGEKGSQNLRKATQERGAKAEDQIPMILNRPPQELWITSQLSPYTPWTGTIFMGRKRITQNIDVSPNATPKKLTLREAEIESVKEPGKLRVERIRRLQRLAYQENHDLYCTPDFYETNSKTTHATIDNSGEKIIYSGNADDGWGLKPNCDRLYKIVDVALVTGKEFFEEGRVRFIVPEHNNEQT